jgi:hypothetical protein
MSIIYDKSYRSPEQRVEISAKKPKNRKASVRVARLAGISRTSLIKRTINNVQKDSSGKAVRNDIKK